ncbi:MAG: hypothetical protein ABFS09_00455 [Thermodesulfobacteriota bacterium]
MSPSNTSSTHEAIQQLRAEIIAPDWQLSPQRIVRLKAAFAALNSYFHGRPHPLALLRMASSAINHFEKDDPQADAMDFLKEDMAHIVNAYEDDEHDPAKEKETASRAYKRFLRLNISLAQDELKTADQTINTTKLLERLTALAEDAGQLPALLEKKDALTAEQGQQAAVLLGKISAAINIAWAHLPPPQSRE